MPLPAWASSPADLKLAPRAQESVKGGWQSPLVLRKLLKQLERTNEWPSSDAYLIAGAFEARLRHHYQKGIKMRILSHTHATVASNCPKGLSYAVRAFCFEFAVETQFLGKHATKNWASWRFAIRIACRRQPEPNRYYLIQLERWIQTREKENWSNFVVKTWHTVNGDDKAREAPGFASGFVVSEYCVKWHDEAVFAAHLSSLTRDFIEQDNRTDHVPG